MQYFQFGISPNKDFYPQARNVETLGEHGVYGGRCFLWHILYHNSLDRVQWMDVSFTEKQITGLKFRLLSGAWKQIGKTSEFIESYGTSSGSPFVGVKTYLNHEGVARSMAGYTDTCYRGAMAKMIYEEVKISGQTFELDVPEPVIEVEIEV